MHIKFTLKTKFSFQKRGLYFSENRTKIKNTSVTQRRADLILKKKDQWSTYSVPFSQQEYICVLTYRNRIFKQLLSKYFFNRCQYFFAKMSSFSGGSFNTLCLVFSVRSVRLQKTSQIPTAIHVICYCFVFSGVMLLKALTFLEKTLVVPRKFYFFEKINRKKY